MADWKKSAFLSILLVYFTFILALWHHCEAAEADATGSSLPVPAASTPSTTAASVSSGGNNEKVNGSLSGGNQDRGLGPRVIIRYGYPYGRYGYPYGGNPGRRCRGPCDFYCKRNPDCVCTLEGICASNYPNYSPYY